MSELPTGTVSLLFSDIEGSTALLKRLGSAYSDALDGQRQVLRRAWAEHGGTELGTEGDSFYVVFPTAEGAVAAAAQGQRDLAAFEWPGGEQVRVRIGIHTGTPSTHDGAYVGMDVHRAARIAGTAHGGQVVLSEATTKLVTQCLPERVRLKDLGSHQLKDITSPEHLFQLAIAGLQVDFPPLKSLGTTSSLPRPATPLVGRDGELAELTTSLSSSDVRLVTLTGPGGSGKTRLAVEVAHRMVERFPDGVYFVPLAAATTADVMWTSIAEVLDVPPEGRIPPGFFDHVVGRSALLVLDNLEQIDGADSVVSQLLAAAQRIVVLATTRHPLHVAGEREHAVPALDLPDQLTLVEAERSGAVQLFVQHAQAVKATFCLTAANAADVVDVCRRLDGLPLAIELAAARSKLLSPAAIAARLNTALELRDTGVDRPDRQRSLRETIAWSYDLLPAQQQAFFRRLAVFAGSADLDAITAVTGDIVNGADPFDLSAELVDASLATINDDVNGEPRIGMLQTIRAYALDQLTGSGETDTVRLAHAQHFLRVADQLRSQRETDYLQARVQAEAELDNFREALTWVLQEHHPSRGIDSRRVSIALRLCADLAWLWLIGGYLTEGQRWSERAIDCADGSPSTELADCLVEFTVITLELGEFDQSRELASQSAALARTLQDNRILARALVVLARANHCLGNMITARHKFEEALTLYRQSGDNYRIAGTLGDLAIHDLSEHNYTLAEPLLLEALKMFEALGDLWGTASLGKDLAYLLGATGRLVQAEQHARQLVDTISALRDPSLTIDFAETYADILVRRGHASQAARLFGAAQAMRERNSMPRLHRVEDVKQMLATAHEQITQEEWDRLYQLGRQESVEDLLHQVSAT